MLRRFSAKFLHRGSKSTMSGISTPQESTMDAASPDSQENGLCTRCTALRLEEMIDKVQVGTNLDSYPEIHLDPEYGDYDGRSAWANGYKNVNKDIEEHFREIATVGLGFDSDSPCALCRLLGRCRNSSIVGAYKLTFCDSPPFSRWNSKLFALFLTFRDPCGEGPEYQLGSMIAATSSSGQQFHPYRSLGTHVDFKWARACVQRCQSTDSGTCFPTATNWTPSFEMLLIDCCTRQIRSIHSCSSRYTALSYVWGKEPSGVGHNLTMLPNKVPKLVEDTIKVTIGLGLQFLWVDRYCITATDPEVKHNQIANMDQVYANAEVTIVSLGNDPSKGLPRVSDGNEVRGKSAQVGKYQFIPIRQRSVYSSELSESVWKSRAWTLQEAALSPRIIYFGRDEMFFQCKKNDFRETLDASFLGRDTSELKNYSGWTKRPFTVLRDCNIEEFWALVKDYCSRNMTYQTDGLNAFLGILHAFAESPRNIQAHWGIPFAGADLVRRESSNDLDLRPHIFAIGLCWIFPDTIRRPNFPSWSWVGWRFETSPYSSPDLSHPCSEYVHIVPRCKQIMCDDGFGASGNLSELESLGSLLATPTMSSQVIRVKGLVAPFKIVDASYIQGADARDGYDDGIYAAFTSISGKLLSSTKFALPTSLRHTYPEICLSKGSAFYLPPPVRQAASSKTSQFYGLILAETENCQPENDEWSYAQPPSILILAIRLTTPTFAYEPQIKQSGYHNATYVGERVGMIRLQKSFPRGWEDENSPVDQEILGKVQWEEHWVSLT